MAQSELLTSFIEEAAEVLAGLERGVAEWSSSPAQASETVDSADTDAADEDSRMNRLSLLAHRLHGSAALYGFQQLSTLAALMERLLDARPHLRGDDHERFVALLGQVTQVLRLGVSELQAGGNDHDLGLTFARLGGAQQLQELVRQRPEAFALRGRLWLPGDDLPPSEQEESLTGQPDLGERLRAFVKENAEVWEYFLPEMHEHLAQLREQLAHSEDADLNVMFRAAHTIKGSSYMVDFRTLGDFAHRTEDLLGALREGAVSLTGDVQRLLSGAADAMDDLLQVAQGAPDEGLEARLGRITAQLEAALVGGPEPAALGAATTSAPAPSPAAPPAEAPAAPLMPDIRVPAGRLEGLMEQVGELVTARARMTRLMGRLDELQASMAASQDRFQRTVRDFEERYLNPDMVRDESGAAASAAMGLNLSDQFAELEFDTYNDLNILSRSITELAADFSEVRRRLSEAVGELSEENEQLGKLVRRLRLDVNQTSRVAFAQATARLRRWARERQDLFTLHVEGEGVMIESGILQRINDPLMHLLTNAVYHGLSREDRAAAQKTPQGNVWIQATEQGNFLEIMVADDGQGLDLPRIRERALERGLRSAQELGQMSDEETGRLVLLPGFSTASEVGNVAGRGVGLDVVATAVRQLGGELLITSEAGIGTVFTLRVPTTQRIMDVLHLDLGQGHQGALPVSSIRALRDVPVHELGRDTRDAEGEQVSWLYEGQRLPVVDLRPMWGTEVTDDTQDAAHLAVASSISGPVALRVADFGQIEEVAVTAPNSVLAQLDYLSGMAVSGSGRALPLLDPAGLLRLSRRPERWLGRVSADELGTPRRVLLVDDSLSVRRLVGKMLERGQYHVTTASDGQEALDLLQLDPTYDGVLTDLEMPRLNGYELLSALRTRPDTARLPVLVMTTRAGEKHQRLAFQLGADDYFTKPVNEALLLRRLGSLLSAPRSPETI